MNDLNTLKAAMKINGVQRMYFKVLSSNDNSKNQVYFGQGFSAISIIPVKEIIANAATKIQGFRAALNFSWLDDDGRLHPAPNAQLILYPQYPEVRFSGFLAGCDKAPTELMTSREEGRILFLGVANNNAIMAYVTTADSAIAQEMVQTKSVNPIGVFQEIQVERGPDYKKLIIDKLTEVHGKGWIESRRLRKDGSSVACRAPQCGGYTLEAEFGITPNGIPQPDIWGWELKNHGVPNFKHLDAGVVTLMTPEPTGGFYKEKGTEQFIRKFGYPDKNGRPDRINFGGIYKFGIPAKSTGLVLEMPGFDPSTNKIKAVDGGLAIIDHHGSCAAMWNYSSLMKIWNTKHAQTAYVPSIRRTAPQLQYRYGPVANLGIGTEFLLFLGAVAAGKVYYDPGIKLEFASTIKPLEKQRSQFRIKAKDAHTLYEKWETVNLTQTT